MATKNAKKNPPKSFENCITSDAAIFNAHFSLLLKKKIPDVSKALKVTPIWKPLGQGSSLAHLMTIFDTWLPPGPPKPT